MMQYACGRGVRNVLSVFRFKVKGEHFAVLHVVNNLSDKKNKKVISRR